MVNREEGAREKIQKAFCTGESFKGEWPYPQANMA